MKQYNLTMIYVIIGLAIVAITNCDNVDKLKHIGLSSLLIPPMWTGLMILDKTFEKYKKKRKLEK